ncbi:MAG: hypothetical protein AB4062_07965, partial [Crocosphaera sp.]
MPNLDITANQTKTNDNKTYNLENKLAPTDSFINRHIGPNSQEIDKMLKVLGFSTLDQLIDATVPQAIRLSK